MHAALNCKCPGMSPWLLAYPPFPPHPSSPAPLLQDNLSGLPSDSQLQQAAVAEIADKDGFNWGYDPVHYGVPEGSYATHPDGGQR